jgi:hypothetical protein
MRLEPRDGHEIGSGANDNERSGKDFSHSLGR